MFASDAESVFVTLQLLLKHLRQSRGSDNDSSLRIHYDESPRGICEPVTR